MQTIQVNLQEGAIMSKGLEAMIGVALIALLIFAAIVASILLSH